MHGTEHRFTAVVLALAVPAAVTVGTFTAPIPTAAVTTGGEQVGRELSQQHVLDGGLADVIVRVRGSSVCSGTPITGTHYVITAAHCVLDRGGEVVATTVERDGVVHMPKAMLVDPLYYATESPEQDAAVLIMDAPIPGPSAALGTSVQRHDLVTLVGLQAIDTDGTLLRGRTYHDHATPKGALGGVVHIQSRPAGCVFGASSVRVEPTQLSVRCGLVPGASGEDCSPSKAAPRCCSE